MLISIIIPVYNVAPYISRCIDSVMSQTYIGEMECIFVDDCGQDDSMDIVQQKIKQYQGTIRFRILTHSHNCGLSAARNTGIEAAQGDYLYFLDSDDWLDPHCISSMVELVEKYPGVEMVQAGAVTHGGGEKPWLDLQNSRLPEFVRGKDTVAPLMFNRKKIPVTAWNRLINKGFLLHYRLFFPENIIHEDELWTFQLSGKLTSLAILKQNVYHYEYHETGLMAKISTQKSQSLVTIVHQMIDDIDGLNSDLTVPYITDFIQVRSFDIAEESFRIEMLDHLTLLFPFYSFFRRLNARLWLSLAKFPVRNHYWLYSLLYHWKI